MKYKIIQALDSDVLETLIAEYIGKGWKPQGGASLSEMKYYVRYTQAMVKEGNR